MHFKQRVEDVKRGVLMAGGFPVELPAISVSESFVKPTTMMYRNFLAMETEELLRSHPVDGAVLMGGCDKTTPGLLLGATSMDIPAIYLPAGPMLRGNWQGRVLGSGSDSWKYWDELRAGKITDQDWLGVEGGIARSYGTCMTMGTASTMTATAEAAGMVLPGGSSIPAADSGHIRLASESGRRIVEMVREDLTPRRIQTRAAFGNAIGQRPTPQQRELGWEVTNWVKDHAEALGVEYLIWDGKIWALSRDDEGWREYNGGGMHDPSDITGGHYDHLHITVSE